MFSRSAGAASATAVVLGALLLGGGAVPALAAPDEAPEPVSEQVPGAEDPGAAEPLGDAELSDPATGAEDAAEEPAGDAEPTEPGAAAQRALAAADLVVTTAADAGPGSLRAAVEAANLDGGAAEITFAAPLTVTLDSPIVVTSPITLLGLGEDQTVITSACGAGHGDALLSLELPTSAPAGPVVLRDLALAGADCELSGLVAARALPGVSLERVTAEQFARPALQLDRLTGPATLSHVTVREISDDDRFGYAAVHLEGTGPMTVTDSRFTDSSTPGLLVDGWLEETEASVTVARNVFARIQVPDNTFVASCLTVDLRVAPVLTSTAAFVADNLLDTCVNSEIGGFQFVNRITDDPNGASGEPALEMTGNTLVNITGIPSIEDQSWNQVDAIDFTIAGKHTAIVRNNTVDARHREIAPPHPEEGGPEVAGVVFSVAPVEVSHNTFLGSTVLFETPWLTEEDVYLKTVFENNVVDAGDQAIRKYRSLDPRLTEKNNVASSIAPFNDPELTRVATSEEIALGPLADNGGVTPTILPQVGSVLIDAGAGSALSPAADQRGVARPWGGAPDVGATEVRGSQLSLSAEQTVTEGETATFTVTRTGNPEIGAVATVRTVDGTAIAGTDYRAKTVTLSWAPGDLAPQTVAVETVKDEPVRAKRSFSVELLSPVIPMPIGEPASTLGHIVDTPPSGTLPELGSSPSAAGGGRTAPGRARRFLCIPSRRGPRVYAFMTAGGRTLGVPSSHHR